MKSIMLRATAVLLCLWLAVGSSLVSIGSAALRSAPNTATPLHTENFSDAELDELFAPIALYPDPLLAQVIPASTFVDELDEASRVLRGRSDDQLIDSQDWDVSVKSVAHYPQVLQAMVQKIDWTTAIGQAYVNQSTDVAKSIQRLRAEARTAGSLVTTQQQQVIVEGQVIRIVPAQPQVIYVPQYNPQVVYVDDDDDGVSTGTAIAATAIAFGAGLAIGAWLNNDWDWHGRGIFYHGWVGGGWIGVNRTFVNVNRNIYVNNRFRNVNINRRVVNRNVSSYRNTLRRDADVRRTRIDNRARDRVRDRDVRDNNMRNRDRSSFNDSRVDALRNKDRDRQRLDQYRGRDNERAAANTRDRQRPALNREAQRPAASNSAFSGIRNGGNEARAQHDRGVASRDSQRQGPFANRSGGDRGSLGNRPAQNRGNRSVGGRGGLGGRRRP
jgi:hypothetical protein